MYIAVKDVKALDNYILLLTFENNEVKRFDMKPYLHISVYQQLKDEKVFKSVKPSFDTIEWNKDIDIDPEILYSESY
ncbi:DUF2442 domain-containing protein [Natronoflexus pectinivorans]|uniref:Uncharacterized protein DUF2442 n=1 Tax=Natronoflexus pectinivorans TaxID=682526 RepID=A0A4V2RWM2_9BACT|nr:DUF2442 domain-containing protein [Natronoflexus pectinivorans]TCO09170.1 uncharacterized protein DUF2442 [Natronoflexus pectinivorans]